jgi:hypothetical protein
MAVRRVALWTLLVAFAVPCLLVLLYFVIREYPEAYCFQPQPRGHEAEVADYQAGATAIHLVAALPVAAALAALSVARNESRGRSRRVGWPTAVVLALYVAYLAAIAVDRDVAESGVILGWLSIIFGPVAIGLAILTAVLLHRRADRAAAIAAWATAWLVIWTLIPGELGLVLTADDPLCLD